MLGIFGPKSNSTVTMTASATSIVPPASAGQTNGEGFGGMAATGEAVASAARFVACGSAKSARPAGNGFPQELPSPMTIPQPTVNK